MSTSELGNHLSEVIEQQQDRLLRLGQRLIPYLTADDLLQPNDFPELEQHPEFRYEEGVLEGLRTALALMRASRG